MIYFIKINPMTGAILEHGHMPQEAWPLAREIDDCLIEVESSLDDLRTVRYDLETGRVVSTEAAPQPTSFINLQRLIYSELAASDWTQVLDAPLDPDKQLAWRSYRSQLRAINSLTDQSEILSRFPHRPDGSSALNLLRDI